MRLKGRPQGPVFGLTCNGHFSSWDLFMLCIMANLHEESHKYNDRICMLVQDAAGLKGRPQGPVFGLTYNGRFSPWDLFMLRGSNGRRTSYNKCAP